MSGAQPSDTVRAILSHKGILMKKHLLEGVKKGAFSEEEAEKRFTNWLEGKNKRVADQSANILKANLEAKKMSFEAEKAKNEARLTELSNRKTSNTEETTTEAKAEETVEENKAEETVEETKAEETEVKAEETATEDKAEETITETKSEES